MLGLGAAVVPDIVEYGGNIQVSLFSRSRSVTLILGMSICRDDKDLELSFDNHS